MHPPDFWQHDGAWSRLLAPMSRLTAAVTARRVARPGWRAPVPVICCGNAGVGGAGKTTLALDLATRLSDWGVGLAFLTRGYGGAVTSPSRVQPGTHDAALVGDEALLLARLAPTFVSPDRAAAARAAIAAGAQLLIMDDGLQNPSLEKTLSLLVIDGAVGFGNARVLPAGPLREPVAAAAARCAAAVLIGNDLAGAVTRLPPGLPVLRAQLRSPPDIAGQRLLAFAGIGRPGKFFDTLREAGAELVATHGFPDHHPYRPTEIHALLEEATHLNAVPVTTPKDAVRLPADLRAAVREVGVRLVWQDETALDTLLATVRP